MMSYNFTTQTHGKWLLAGEHTVLRGHPVIVFPVPSKTVTLKYIQSDKAVSAEFSGYFAEDAHLLFWSILEHGLEKVQRSLSDISGKFILDNNIPIGAGMGASAALCAAIARWFIWQAWIDEQQLFEFSRELEHLFHGQSSGVDIIGAIHDRGMLYTPGAGPQALTMNWQPCWYLSDTEQLGITSHCVKKVNELQTQNPTLAKRIDTAMHESVLNAVEALQQSPEQGLEPLAAAINKANLCFTQWGLAGGKVEQHIHDLLATGAIAAKPTGSGDGGYVISLWSEPPPDTLKFKLVAV